MTSSVEIFFSYAHEDEIWRIELEKHLGSLQRRRLIATWHDRNISAQQSLWTIWQGFTELWVNMRNLNRFTSALRKLKIRERKCHDLWLISAVMRSALCCRDKGRMWSG